MWKCVFGYGNTRFWLRQDTGTMNRSPTPNGVFVAYFTDCSLAFCGMFATLSQTVRHVFRVCSLRIRWLNMMCL
ncbi:hypothetical protein [Prevotella pallens]|uniref:hypothetical protein n=1 Tax=Prevotella pallens TaxID=60133 RepID=UPI001CAF9AB9|nr:hypothetical protein [Prevotella pallens]MBF1518352.1 hypothetical protein [Prevotella pallens]